eukprot:7272218-Pyramimonas_sp.AAC.1
MWHHLERKAAWKLPRRRRPLTSSTRRLTGASVSAPPPIDGTRCERRRAPPEWSLPPERRSLLLVDRSE